MTDQPDLPPLGLTSEEWGAAVQAATERTPYFEASPEDVDAALRAAATVLGPALKHRVDAVKSRHRNRADKVAAELAALREQLALGFDAVDITQALSPTLDRLAKHLDGLAWEMRRVDIPTLDLSELEAAAVRAVRSTRIRAYMHAASIVRRGAW